MSAFAALQSGNVFAEDEDDVITYDKNSDDENNQQEPIRQPSPETPSIRLNFVSNADKVIYNNDDVLVGLQVNESIMVSGQFKLVVERGAIHINNIHYYHAPQVFDVIQANVQSLSLISSTQVVNSDDVEDFVTEDNEHLFSSDYKSVIRLVNLNTGIDGIARYYLPFKNMFKLSDSMFQNYSFELITETSNMEVINYDKSWINRLLLISQATIDPPMTYMVIGNKNSGKSTALKSLLNCFVEKNVVSVLDLDPGQSEYSVPYCLSITNHNKPIIGYNHHMDGEDIHYFYGFTTPQSNPDLYISIVKQLYHDYVTKLAPKGHLLLVNTPGWVKGYGKQLLVEITGLINPHNLIYLTSGPGDVNSDDILMGLTYQDLIPSRGTFIKAKYSAGDTRTLNKLLYFHRELPLKYNFHHTLERLPVKISYQTGPDHVTGINLVSVLNHDLHINFDSNDLPLMLDVCIVGVYAIEDEYYHINSQKFNHTSPTNPPYLNACDYNEFISSTEVKFIGLAMVHSINVHDTYFNLYFPPNNSIQELKTLTSQNYKLMLVKGEGDIPSSELLMPELMNQFQESYLKTKHLSKFPYISYNNKISGTWKIRRNVMRRSQR